MAVLLHHDPVTGQTSNLIFVCQCTKGYQYESVYRDMAMREAISSGSEVVEVDSKWLDGTDAIKFYIKARKAVARPIECVL